MDGDGHVIETGLPVWRRISRSLFAGRKAPSEMPKAVPPSPRLRLLLNLRFGQGGNEAPHLGEGWSHPQEGHRWAIDQTSELRLPSAGSHGFLLVLTAQPYLHKPEIERQHLAIRAGDRVLGTLAFDNGRPQGLHVPAGIVPADDDMILWLDHPDAARPADFDDAGERRRLSLGFYKLLLFEASEAVQRRRPGRAGPDAEVLHHKTDLPPADLVTRFESLGDNCEFGLVQRRAGAEPLGLLRFANIGLPALLRALDAGFEGIGNPARIDVWISGKGNREVHMRDRSHSLTFHTGRVEGDVEPAKLLSQQAARLKFLARKLMEDVVAGEKIFVLRCNRQAGEVSEHHVLALVAALNLHGPCTVLWASHADAANTPGTVVQVMPGFLRGYLDRLAPDDNAHDLSFEVWLDVCANALSLMSSEIPGD